MFLLLRVVVPLYTILRVNCMYVVSYDDTSGEKQTTYSQTLGLCWDSFVNKYFNGAGNSVIWEPRVLPLDALKSFYSCCWVFNRHVSIVLLILSRKYAFVGLIIINNLIVWNKSVYPATSTIFIAWISLKDAYTLLQFNCFIIIPAVTHGHLDLIEDFQKLSELDYSLKSNYELGSIVAETPKSHNFDSQ